MLGIKALSGVGNPVTYLHGIGPFAVLKERTFSERPRTDVEKGANSIQGMRRSKTHRGLP